MELYFGQTTWNSSSPPHKIEQEKNFTANRCEQFTGPYCQLTKALDLTRKAVKRQDASLCEKLDEAFKVDCIAVVYFNDLRVSISPIANKEDILNRAELLKDKYPTLYKNFTDMLAVDLITDAESAERSKPFVPQQKGINNLLILDKNGNFKNKSIEYGVDIGGWTWNARFADIDSDEWQDLFVVNGWTPSELETTNVFFKNNQGKGFSNVTAQFNVLDFEPTIAFTYIDYDNDGDLDIISYGQAGRTAIIQNNLHHNNLIQFELRDKKGNSQGIGSTIIIHYGKDSTKHQIREIKMSGGHLSFDPKIAHFGLGTWTSVSSIDIQWSTGEKETFKGPFLSNHRYRISR
jgi:hypothetical protein